MGQKTLLFEALHIERFTILRDPAAVGSVEICFLRGTGTHEIKISFDPCQSAPSDYVERPDGLAHQEYASFSVTTLEYARDRLQRMMRHWSDEVFFDGSTFSDLQLRAIPSGDR